MTAEIGKIEDGDNDKYVYATQFVPVDGDTSENAETQLVVISQEVTPDLIRINKLQVQMDEIRVTGKVERCGEIKDHTYSTSCEVYTLFDRAKSKTDLAVCDKGTTDEVKELCRKTIELNLK